ncbi:MAG: DNA mismatch repair protein MutS [Candidatus Binatia bacterium]|nr:DNA mismatch repair protein MutS [Candidatus Binatia bacterium]
MLAQYLRVKEQAGDAVLFFRMGDFYEMFFEDAERAAPLLDLTLTSRNKDAPNPIPMCGLPYHAAQGYVGRLLGHGLKVAICDQLSDPATSPGLVERGLVRVITPGTLLDEDEGLRPSEPGFLAALVRAEDAIAIACIEVTTGQLRCCVAPSERAAIEELARIGPRETVLPPDDEKLHAVAAGAGGTPTQWAARDDGAAVDAAIERLSTGSDAGASSPAATGALRLALGYVNDTVRGGLDHLREPVFYEVGEHLMLDERSRRNLAVLEGADGTRHGSLWWAVDRTRTAMGARRLREWLLYPLLDLDRIGDRLDGVEHLVDSPGLREDIATGLRAIGDLERLVARFGVRRAGPREVARLGRALALVDDVGGILGDEGNPPLLGRIRERATPPVGLAAAITTHIEEAPPMHASEGGVIRAGADEEVDRLRSLLSDAQTLIAELEAREREATGISSLKIKYHRVLGYFFDVTKPNLKLVPEHFIRRQSMASGERYSSPELKELEDQLATAESRSIEREVALFEEVLAQVQGRQAGLTELADALADLDGLCGLAATAHDQGYVRPKLHKGDAIRVRDGRHPVVEQTSAKGSFVANDVNLDGSEEQLVLLTGPNMAGKSTYLRQVALIVLLAHAGSFVPAAKAEVPLTDRIWTRVGAADDLVAGDSTFMVEMKETSAILANLTPRTLVVLDEIGRGTSTYDGIAIAWAVAEYLHEVEPAPGARVKTLFATHFHELTALSKSMPRVRNHSVSVREWKDDVLFLRKVVEGPASRSYGIAVARLAGVPDEVVGRARDLLAQLEDGKGPEPQGAFGEAEKPTAQLDLFNDPMAALKRELASLEVDSMTPLEALTRLGELRDRARRS